MTGKQRCGQGIANERDEVNMNTEKRKSVEDYLSSFPDKQRNLLNQLRALIKKTIPQCEEKLSWGAPTYMLEGRYCLQFAGNQKHLGFYTSPTTIRQFRTDLTAYKTNEKNTLQLSWDQPLPEDLLIKMIQFRAEEVRQEALK